MAVGSRVLADLRSFQERAREAERYGSDPWVFVRELLQNARDAGAQRVHLTTVEHHGLTSIRCRDDGSGMSFEHARRYLRPLRLGQGGWTRERRPLRRGLLVGPPLRAPADRGALLASRELTRLIERQLDLVHREPLWQRSIDGGGGRGPAGSGWRRPQAWLLPPGSSGEAT